MKRQLKCINIETLENLWRLNPDAQMKLGNLLISMADVRRNGIRREQQHGAYDTTADDEQLGTDD